MSQYWYTVSENDPYTFVFKWTHMVCVCVYSLFLLRQETKTKSFCSLCVCVCVHVYTHAYMIVCTNSLPHTLPFCSLTCAAWRSTPYMDNFLAFSKKLISASSGVWPLKKSYKNISLSLFYSVAIPSFTQPVHYRGCRVWQGSCNIWKHFAHIHIWTIPIVKINSKGVI